MSVLSDRDIRAELEAGRVRIAPYDPGDLQPSSVDLHLDRSFRVFRNNRYAYIDPRTPQPDLTELLTVEDDEPFVLHPGEFVLGQTVEWVELPGDLVARLEGKSSLGRLGLLIHSTAGYVDPGWKGTLTLELSNVANLPIALYAGMRIGQISFFRMSSAVERPYGSATLGSKYQGQSEPTASAFHADFERGRRLPKSDPSPGTKSDAGEASVAPNAASDPASPAKTEAGETSVARNATSDPAPDASSGAAEGSDTPPREAVPRP